MAGIALALAALVVSASGCATSEGSEIGTCPIRPGSDCAGNYMKGSGLRYAMLFDANLDHADLTGVDLAWSNLAGATIREGDLARANLTGAQLGYADLGGANLAGANLTGTILTFTNLYGANMSRARLKGAEFCRTIMPDGTIANPTC